MISNVDALPSCLRQEQLNFSPVSVRQSPVSKNPKRGNITGNARTVRDTVADFYNLVQRWNFSHLSGADILEKIMCLKSSTIDSWSKTESDVYPEGLQLCCNILENICKDLTSTVSKMEQNSKQLLAMCELENHQQRAEEGVESAGPTPMFLTWPMERFAKVASELTAQYSTELEVKNLVLEGVCHCTSQETLMFHVSAWAQQPTMANENAMNCQMEAMLVETGYR